MSVEWPSNENTPGFGGGTEGSSHQSAGLQIYASPSLTAEHEPDHVLQVARDSMLTSHEQGPRRDVPPDAVPDFDHEPLFDLCVELHGESDLEVVLRARRRVCGSARLSAVDPAATAS